MIFLKKNMLIFLLFFYISACSFLETQKKSPTDRLIEGPFEITEKWQEIKFNPPLEVMPHIHDLEILFDKELEAKEVVPDDKYHWSFAYIDPNTKVIIKPEVMLITEKGNRFSTKAISSGWNKVNKKTFKTLGFGIGGSDEGIFNYPKGTKIIAAKIRSNINITVENLHWIAPHYWRNPDKNWKDVNDSKILKFN